jgi:hypothetical protein
LETSTEEIAMAYFNELSSNSPRGTEKKWKSVILGARNRFITIMTDILAPKLTYSVNVK